ncbi:2-methoxy-6-polyprenyl-1,4-benzoquinol methylase, mitochondrial [Lingula anatina]|uniref:2-methoxy-6-polyprenyl-1,4-benzoquinol methylase, mitochondrial n=1 Tax=Lingula anatina TaxID=7574 RepID=A0A1S3JV24_LINAN|nr:2-methoxy-6-polyprenyl-1,4-benzoquinol methylase, mitochondrial [Lingula anatina]|eukprot:XP_013413944.1 2-methoxy-6-polyprenyl-1,4-benzoquinol methylase, mitochondrial [Lingula anatina]
MAGKALVFRNSCRFFRYRKLSRILVAKRHISTDADYTTDERSTHFGFQHVSEKEKEEKVYKVFENVASKYDQMNDAMSFGVHRLWKDHFMRRLSPASGTKLLDVAGGTGDIAFRFLEFLNNQGESFTKDMYPDIEDLASAEKSVEESDSMPEHFLKSSVTVCDINQAMLDVGKEKAQNMGFTSGISWIKGNAEDLPLPDNTFDAYTIAFGIRNCTHVDRVLEEAYRVIKPGGRFMCLEFSEVKNSMLSFAYDNYSFQVIPVLGQIVANDWKSYQYLVESIRQFPNQEEFAAMIKDAGFSMVTFENLTFGVAAIHSGFKL